MKKWIHWMFNFPWIGVSYPLNILFHLVLGDVIMFVFFKGIALYRFCRYAVVLLSRGTVYRESLGHSTSKWAGTIKRLITISEYIIISWESNLYSWLSDGKSSQRKYNARGRINQLTNYENTLLYVWLR